MTNLQIAAALASLSAAIFSVGAIHLSLRARRAIAMNNAQPAPTVELIQPAPVKRDETGCFWHPDMPEFDEDYPKFRAWLDAQGLEIAVSELDDEKHPTYIEYYENNGNDLSAWTDEPPYGAGWFTLYVTDSEDGPVWVWARRTAAMAATQPSNKEE